MGYVYLRGGQFVEEILSVFRYVQGAVHLSQCDFSLVSMCSAKEGKTFPLPVLKYANLALSRKRHDTTCAP